MSYIVNLILEWKLKKSIAFNYRTAAAANGIDWAKKFRVGWIHLRRTEILITRSKSNTVKKNRQIVLPVWSALLWKLK